MFDVIIEDLGDKRHVEIRGRHYAYGGWREESQFDTFYSQKLLERILKTMGDHVRDDIDRVENPDYLEKPLRDFLDLYSIELEDKLILDFGCGSGASSIVLIRLGASKVTGVDIDKDRIQIAQIRARECSLGDVTQFCVIPNSKILPFQDNSFEIILCNAVIEHIPPTDRKAWVKELWRVIRPGGYILIWETPNRLWPKEIHTTGLWFLPYLPLRWARIYANLFGKSTNHRESLDDLIAKGFRGVTYWKIINSIKNDRLVEMNKIVKLNVNQIFSLSLSKDQNRLIREAKRTVRTFFKVVNKLILEPFNLPLSAFLPYLAICLKKSRRKSNDTL